MTRINCIPVASLVDKHLVAEYRELPRVFKLARSNIKIPSSYRLGTGHVTFFYDKLAFLYNRQKAIVSEMAKRGFKTNFDPENLKLEWQSAKSHLWNDWKPSAEDQALNLSRINERLKDMEKK